MESRDGSTTPNSMVVLERGAGGISTVVSPSASRPPSGRRSRNMTPVQRSGSQLEVLPPEDEATKDRSGSRTSSRTGHRPSSRSGSAENSPRQTQSAGSSGRRSRQGQESSDAGFNRANSLDGLASPTQGDSRPGSAIHKQISLTTVKRNYETHGIPKNESWDFVPEDIARLTPPLTNGTTHTYTDKNKTLGATGGLSHEAEGVRGVGVDGGNGDGVNVLSEKERTEQRLKYLMEQLSMKDKELKQHEERRKSGSAAKRKESLGKNKDPSSTISDSYYVSTGSRAEMNPDEEPSTSKGASARPPPFLEDSKDDKTDKNKEDDDDDNEDDDDDEEDEEEGPTAPIELMGEFLDSVMDEDYETADKLCKMILIYEPDNPECLQFKPLIEEMLKKIWHRQLYGSSSEDESGEEDDDDDDEDDDEEEEEEEEDSDEDSDEEESSESDSSEESEDENETENKTSVVYQNGPDTSTLDAIR